MKSLVDGTHPLINLHFGDWQNHAGFYLNPNKRDLQPFLEDQPPLQNNNE